MEDLVNKKLKVLICAFACLKDPDRRFGFGEGGEGVLGWNITSQLSRFFDVLVLTHSINKKAIEQARNKKNDFRVKFYYIDLPKFLNFTKKWIQIYAYLWQIKAYFVARKLHKQNNFDVFHHVTYANDWMASFMGALLPVPYIRGPGGGAHYVPEKFVKEYSLKERLAQRIRSIGQWVFKHDPFFIISQNRAKAILVCNKEAFDALPRKWQHKMHLFPVNGISQKDISLLAQKIKKETNKFLVLTAGKLIKIKAFDLAIEAFKEFSKKAPNAGLIIIGDGPELSNLKKIVSELKLEEKVIFEGWMPREKLLQKMLDCDIFLFSSLRDGGGAVVVEAMAAGKPVVCLDIGGPGFHINNKYGIKIKPDNPKQAIKKMADALKLLYCNKRLREKLGRVARKRVESFYLWDRLGERLLEIYKNVLNF